MSRCPFYKVTIRIDPLTLKSQRNVLSVPLCSSDHRNCRYDLDELATLNRRLLKLTDAARTKARKIKAFRLELTQVSIHFSDSKHRKLFF